MIKESNEKYEHFRAREEGAAQLWFQQTETHHQENELRKKGVSSIPTKKYNQEED